MKHVLLSGILLVTAGCAPAYVAEAPPAGHPASADAAAAPYTPPANLADVAADVPAPLLVQAPPAQASAASPLPEPASAQMKEVLGAYLAVGDLLAKDEANGIAQHAQHLSSALDALAQTEVPADPHLWHRLAEDLELIRAEAAGLLATGELGSARAGFGRLSDALVRVIAATGAPEGLEAPLNRFVCGMFAEAPSGGVWLQLGNETRNPYFGTQMLTCHREQAPISPSAGHDESGEASPSGHEHHQMGGQ